MSRAAYSYPHIFLSWSWYGIVYRPALIQAIYRTYLAADSETPGRLHDLQSLPKETHFLIPSLAVELSLVMGFPYGVFSFWDIITSSFVSASFCVYESRVSITTSHSDQYLFILINACSMQFVYCIRLLDLYQMYLFFLLNGVSHCTHDMCPKSCLHVIFTVPLKTVAFPPWRGTSCRASSAQCLCSPTLRMLVIT